LKVFSPIGIKR